MSSRWFRWLSLALLIWTLLVVVWGAYVRATGSGAGCGDHWPLCDGEVIPRAPSVEKMIEFTHRVTSGLAGILSLVVFVAAMKTHARGHRVRKAAGTQLFFMVTESLVGAGLVLFEYVAHDTSEARALWSTAHLANTFLLIASMAVLVYWSYGGAPVRVRGQGKLAWVLFGALAATMLVGISGAVAALGATLFPAASLAEGLAADFSPTAHLFVRLRVFHLPIAVVASLLSVAAGVYAALARPAPLTQRLATILAVCFLLQLGVGTVNLVLHAPVSLQLIHLLVADFVWIALVLLSASALAVREEGAR